MRPLVLPLISLFVLAGLAGAQAPSGNIFLGYSYDRAAVSNFRSFNTNGWEASVEGKLIPHLGIVADIDGHYGSALPLAFPVQPAGVCVPTCPPVSSTNFSEYHYLFGPRVSVSFGKVRPFAEALFGASHISGNNGFNSDTSFATAFGGGFDYKIVRPMAFRLEMDAVRTNFFSVAKVDFRPSSGIVFRF